MATAFDKIAIACFGIGAIGMAAEQAIKDSPDMTAALPQFPGWLSYLPLIMFAFGGFFWLLQRLSPRSLTPVYSKAFSKEAVNLDGHIFHHCTFTDVTFIFNGGNFHFDDCMVHEPFEFKTESGMVGNTIRLILILNQLAPGKLPKFEAIPAKFK